MQVIRKIHKWSGLIAGLFLFIICLTGALIAFSKIIGSYSPFFKWCVGLHKTLFLGPTGSLIVGIATLLMVVVIITGYILWVKEARAVTKSSIRRGLGWRRGFGKSLSVRFPYPLMGWHVAGGVYVGIPLLLMALTGLTWSFGWYADIVNYLFADANANAADQNLFHTIHSLHVGSWWKPLSRILWCLATLLGASLPVTGLLLGASLPVTGLLLSLRKP